MKDQSFIGSEKYAICVVVFEVEGFHPIEKKSRNLDS